MSESDPRTLARKLSTIAEDACPCEDCFLPSVETAITAARAEGEAAGYERGVREERERCEVVINGIVAAWRAYAHGDSL